MIEPIKIDAYECPVCDEQLFDCSLAEARLHVSVPVDDTRLPIGLFFIYRCKDKPYYSMINDNSGELNSDHSFVHTLIDQYFPGREEVLTFQGIRDVSYRDILRRFERKLSRFLSQDEFDKLFSNPKNESIEGHVPLRTCPQLEGIVVKIQ